MQNKTFPAKNFPWLFVRLMIEFRRARRRKNIPYKKRRERKVISPYSSWCCTQKQRAVCFLYMRTDGTVPSAQCPKSFMKYLYCKHYLDRETRISQLAGTILKFCGTQELTQAIEARWGCPLFLCAVALFFTFCFTSGDRKKVGADLRRGSGLGAMIMVFVYAKRSPILYFIFAIAFLDAGNVRVSRRRRLPSSIK